LRFEWDKRKADVNNRKHGVLFNEAATVFADSLSFSFPDVDHSDDEERYLTIGMSMAGRILVVAHTDRGEKIRLISAREATRKERLFYEENK
jgi:uncharacterized DUF497 family protein